MAQLKDLLVSGPSRLIGKLFANEVQLTTLNIPTTSNGTTYGPGTNNYVPVSNGTSIYWSSAAPNATTAAKLGSNAGSSTQPIYFANGVPTAITGNIANGTTGNAATATKFSSNATVTLTGDATGTSAGSTKSWSVPVTLANSGATAGSYGNDGNVSPSAGGTFLVPYVTVDAKGRVTAISNKTITLPTASSSASTVTTTEDTTNILYVVGVTSSATTTLKRDTSVTVAGGTVTATTFAGSLSGNAATATKLATARNLGVALGSTTAVTFDGSANQTSIPVSGTLGVGNGGTGKTSWTQWGVVYASATNALANTGAGTSGQYLKSNGSSAPTWESFPSTWTPSSHTHGNISNDGKVTTSQTLASNDYIIIGDNSDGGKLIKGPIFDGSTATKALTQKGTWETFNNYSLPLAANGTRGGVQIGYTTSGKNYAVQLSSEKMYVNVPWENTTYSAGTGLSLSGTTFNHSNSVTAKTAAAQSAKTLTWGGTFTIYEEKYDAQGHVTGVASYNMTMPANPNTDTDTKVTQSASTASNWRKILLHYKDDATSTTAVTTSTNQVYAAVGISAQASTGTIRANSYKVTDSGTITYNTSNGCIEIIC